MKRPARRAGRASKQVTAALLHRWPLPTNDGALGKDDRGQVMVVGGSETVPGAAILSAIGALRAGAGKLQIATTRGVAPLVAVTVPEARVVGLPHDRAGELSAQGWSRLMHDLEGCDSALVGPGMMGSTAATGLLKRCAREKVKATLIVDAAALDAFAGPTPLPTAHRAGVIVTPHAGEMAHLWRCERDEVLADPLGFARQTAERLGAVVILKGPCTHIVAPDGTAFHNTTGNPGLGTSGSGDTLSGVIAGLCARGADLLQASAWGVHLHGCAGDVLARQRGPLGFLARELLTEIPPLLAKLGRG